jgi:hypothetical protein
MSQLLPNIGIPGISRHNYRQSPDAGAAKITAS